MGKKVFYKDRVNIPLRVDNAAVGGTKRQKKMVPESENNRLNHPVTRQQQEQKASGKAG
jgi:hypothetical protein